MKLLIKASLVFVALVSIGFGLMVTALILLIRIGYCFAETIDNESERRRVARSWKRVRRVGAWSYHLNEISGQRKAVHDGCGLSLLDRHWLRVGDFVIDEFGQCHAYEEGVW